MIPGLVTTEDFKAISDKLNQSFEGKFKRDYINALRKWATQVMASPGNTVTDGTRASAQAILDGFSPNASYQNTKLAISAVDAAWKAYNQDPASYIQRVTEGKEGEFQQGALPHFSPLMQGPEAAAQAAEAEQTESSIQEGSDLMRRFAESMMKPLDPNDPAVQRVQQMAGSAASRNASNRGIEGGLAVSNSQEMITRALADQDLQRKQIGLSALGQANNFDLTRAQMAQAAYNAQWQNQMSQMQQQYQQRAGQAQGIGAIIGGGLGAVAGGYFGGPMGAAAGMQAGSSIGGGLGGMTAGQQPYLPYNPPSAGYQSRGLGGYRGIG